jgi:hypothetical protein
MADYRIACVNKPDRNSPHERITHVGGPKPDGTGTWKDTVANVVGFIENNQHRFYTKEGNASAWVAVRTSTFCERSCCGLGCQRGDRAHRATHKSPRSAGSQMSKDEANTMSDQPAAVEQGGEGDAGRETMQALDRLESEIAQAPAETPRSSSMTTICCEGQPSAVALETKAYWRRVDSRLCST